MINHPEQDFIGPDKPVKKRKKKPTGILKDLMELKRYYNRVSIKNSIPDSEMIECRIGAFVEWSDVEAIIKKYNP